MKKVLLLLLISIYLYPQSPGQQYLDSIYAELITLRTQNSKKIVHEEHPDKCALSLHGNIAQNLKFFTAEQQLNIKKVLERPTKSNSIVSPSGKFRIHYNITGNDAPTYSVTEAAALADFVYDQEINVFGYAPPQQDGDAGGDNKYDIYISNIGSNGSGLYGYTSFEEEFAPGKYISYMVVDNDYLGFYSSGISGLKVTLAHEFFHAIQIGAYIYRDEDAEFFELASTAMEEFIFDEVNDYLSYLSDFLEQPELQFLDDYRGYDLAIWNIFLNIKFGRDILKRQWELMPNMRAVQAISLSLEEQGTTFRKEFNQFGIWCYYTNYRAFPQKYFPEGQLYPLIKPLSKLEYPANNLVNMAVKPLSINYLQFNNTNNRDTIVAVITNSNIVEALDSVTHVDQIIYQLSSDSITNSVQISPGYFVSFRVDHPSLWSVSEIKNKIIAREDQNIFIPENLNLTEYCFPNPFKYGEFYNTGRSIYFVVPDKFDSYVNFNVYSTSMDQIFSGTVEVTNYISYTSFRVVRWEPRNKNGELLPSGVYIYVINSDDNDIKGKLVILNE